MPDYIIYDPSSAPVANLVTRFLRSFDKARELELGANIVESPNLAEVDPSEPMKWTGTAVVNLTQQERDSIIAARNSSNLTALKAAAKNIFLSPDGVQAQAIALGFRAQRDIMRAEINILRTQAGLTPRTAAEINTVFKTTYENYVDALS